MAWSIVGITYGTTSATPTAHQIGDTFIICAYRDGSNTGPTMPAGVGLIEIDTVGTGNTNSERTYTKVATTTSETTGTHTNATSVCCIVIRNGSIGNSAKGGNANTTFSYTGFTLQNTSGSSGLIAICASRDPAAAAATAPSPFTNHSSVSDATDILAVQYDLSSTSFSTVTQATGVASNGWRTRVIEIIDETPGANTVGKTSMGATAQSLTDLYATKFTPSFSGTINEIRVRVRHNFGGGDNLRVAVYSVSAGAPNAPTLQATASYNPFPSDSGVHIARFTAFTGTTTFTNAVDLFLVVWADSNSVYDVFRDSGAANQMQAHITGGVTPFTWPNPFPSVDSSTANQINIWIEGTPSGGSANVTPGTGQVIATGFAPTVSVSNNISVSPGVGVLSVTGFAPTIRLNIFSYPGTGNAILNGFAPTIAVSNNISVSPGVGNIIINGFSPTVTATQNAFVNPDTGALLLNGFSPVVSVTQDAFASPGTGSGIFTGLEPTVSVTNNVNVTPGLGQGLFIGYEPSVQAGAGASPGTGVLLLTGFEPTVSVTNHINVLPGTGQALLNGFSPVISISSNTNVEPGTGQIIITGYEPTVLTPVNISTGTGVVIFTGYPPLAYISPTLVKPHYFVDYTFTKQAHSIDFTFVKQAHYINYTSEKSEHLVNYTFNKDSHSINYTFVKTNIVVDTD